MISCNYFSLFKIGPLINKISVGLITIRSMALWLMFFFVICVVYANGLYAWQGKILLCVAVLWFILLGCFLVGSQLGLSSFTFFVLPNHLASMKLSVFLIHSLIPTFPNICCLLVLSRDIWFICFLTILWEI